MVELPGWLAVAWTEDVLRNSGVMRALMPEFLLKRKPFCHYSERNVGRNGREEKELWLIRKFCTDRTVGGFRKAALLTFDRRDRVEKWVVTDRHFNFVEPLSGNFVEPLSGNNLSKTCLE